MRPSKTQVSLLTQLKVAIQEVLDAFQHALQAGRCALESPTSENEREANEAIQSWKKFAAAIERSWRRAADEISDWRGVGERDRWRAVVIGHKYWAERFLADGSSVVRYRELVLRHDGRFVRPRDETTMLQEHIFALASLAERLEDYLQDLESPAAERRPRTSVDEANKKIRLFLRNQPPDKYWSAAKLAAELRLERKLVQKTDAWKEHCASHGKQRGTMIAKPQQIPLENLSEMDFEEIDDETLGRLVRREAERSQSSKRKLQGTCSE